MPGGIHAPPEEILSWPRSNYDNPTLRPNTIFWIACICGPITVCMLLARLWVRIFYQRNPGWDDWLMLIATMAVVALTVIIPCATRTVFDKHMWDLNLFADPDMIVAARKYVLVILTLFCSTSGMIKISILLFYRRLSDRVVSKKFQRVTWFSIGFIAVYTVVMTIVPIFGCKPISAFWDQMHPFKMLSGYEYQCFNEGADVVVSGIVSAVLDLITAILPTFLYWNLQIPSRQKVALFGIFAIGYGGVALASLRAYFSWRIYYATYDVSWETWKLFLVTILELHVGAFCANAPSLKILFNRFFHEKLILRAKTSGSLGQRSSKKNHSLGSKTGKSNNSLFEKVAYILSGDGTTHSKNGYVFEHNARVSVDMLGGVQIEREFNVVHSPLLTINTKTSPVRHGDCETADTISILCNYDDIELGRYITDTNSRTPSLDDAEIRPPPPIFSRTLGLFHTFKSRAQSPTLGELSNLPGSVATFHTMDNDMISPPTAPHFSPRRWSWQKPQWQTWS